MSKWITKLLERLHAAYIPPLVLIGVGIVVAVIPFACEQWWQVTTLRGEFRYAFLVFGLAIVTVSVFWFVRAGKNLPRTDGHDKNREKKAVLELLDSIVKCCEKKPKPPDAPDNYFWTEFYEWTTAGSTLWLHSRSSKAPSGVNCLVRGQGGPGEVVSRVISDVDAYGRPSEASVGEPKLYHGPELSAGALETLAQVFQKQDLLTMLCIPVFPYEKTPDVYTDRFLFKEIQPSNGTGRYLLGVLCCCSKMPVAATTLVNLDKQDEIKQAATVLGYQIAKKRGLTQAGRFDRLAETILIRQLLRNAASA
jgi:hypothetical protein